MSKKYFQGRNSVPNHKTISCFIQEPDPKTTPTADLAITTVNKNLFTDFSSALNNGKFSDVILVCGGQKFRVHKGILASRFVKDPKVTDIPLRLQHAGWLKKFDL